MTGVPKPYYDDGRGIVIYLGDCRDILPHLPKVDLVLKSGNHLSTDSRIINHEEESAGASRARKGRDILEREEGGDSLAVLRVPLVDASGGVVLGGVPDGIKQGNDPNRDFIAGQGQGGCRERSLQVRHPEPDVSSIDRQGQMLNVSDGGAAGSASQERRPLRQPVDKSSNPLRGLPQQASQNTVVAQAQIICLTDPPYGIKRDKGFGGFEGFGGFGTPIARRQYPDCWDSERPDETTFSAILHRCDLAIIWGGNFFADRLPRSTHWLVWDKLNSMPSFGDCELAWTSSNRKSVKKYTVEWNGLISKEEHRHHPTQKPLALMLAVCRDYSKQPDTILDPFMGSGTTLVAAKQLGRRAIGIEIESKYCDIAIKRLEQEVLPLDMPQKIEKRHRVADSLLLDGMTTDTQNDEG